MDLIIWYPNFVGLLLWLYIPRREKRTAPASWFQAIFPIMHIYIHKVYVYIRNKMLNMGELYTSILMNNWRINVPEPSNVPWYLYIWNLFGTFEGPGTYVFNSVWTCGTWTPMDQLVITVQLYQNLLLYTLRCTPRICQ